VLARIYAHAARAYRHPALTLATVRAPDWEFPVSPSIGPRFPRSGFLETKMTGSAKPSHKFEPAISSPPDIIFPAASGHYPFKAGFSFVSVWELVDAGDSGGSEEEEAPGVRR
jgi:hypothetical protein